MTLPIPRSTGQPPQMNRSNAALMLAVTPDSPPSDVAAAASRTRQLVEAEGRQDLQRILQDAHDCLTDPHWQARQRPALGNLGVAVLLATEIAVLVAAFQLVTAWSTIFRIVPEGESAPVPFLMLALVANLIWLAVIVWRSLSPLRGRPVAKKMYWIATAVALLIDLVCIGIPGRVGGPDPYAFSPFIVLLTATALVVVNHMLTTNREKRVVQS